MNPHMLLLLAADEGGSFTVAPSAGLVLWTLFGLLLAALVAYAAVRLVARRRRAAGRR